MMPGFNNRLRAIRVGWLPWAVAAIVAGALFACMLCPVQSYAYFNQVDDKNSAQQDIGEYGDAIAASEVSDGVYQITARTTSRMCILYDTAQDAATRSDNKGYCTLVASGGSLSATFYMSAAYTHIFMGTGEQAARLTDAEGTDDSAYVKGEVVPVPTPSGTVNAYRYTMAIPALNSPIMFSSYDGGSVGIANGKWFNRQVVFLPSDEVAAAIGGDGPSDSPASDSPSDPIPDSDPGSNSEAGSDPIPEASPEASLDSGKQDDGAGKREAAPPSESASSREPRAGENAVASRQLPVASPAIDAGQDTASGEDGASVAAEGVQAGAAKSGNKLRGTLISPAVANAPAFEGGASVVAVADDAAEASPNAFVPAFVLAGIAFLGVLARTVIYLVEKKGGLG